jgi:hypothetical protein
MYRKVAMGEEREIGIPRAAVELFRVRGRSRACERMARHVATRQLLAAMDGGRWGIWVAAPGDEPRDPEWVEVAADEALLLEPGVWHHGPVPLEREEGAYLTVEAPGTNVVDFEAREVARGR